MLRMRNPEIHTKSAAAEHTFRRLRQWNLVVLILLGIMVVLAIWNVLAMTRVFDSDVPDLADIGSIRDHISSRLVYEVGTITLTLFVFKEWRYGERSFGMVYFLAPLLFLVLVPVMSLEAEGDFEPMKLEFALNRCEPGAIENGQLLNTSSCEVVKPVQGDVFLSKSDPMNGDVDLLEPDRLALVSVQWEVEGRGNFRVYFLFRQDSMYACNDSAFASEADSQDPDGHHCLEHNGEVWSVHPFETSLQRIDRLTLYQVLP